MGIIIRQSFKATIVNYIGMVLGAFNVVILFPLVFTPTEIGLTGILVDVALLFASFAQFGVNNTMVRFFPKFKSDEQKHNGFFFFSMAQALLGFLLTALLVWVYKDDIMARYVVNSPLFTDYFLWLFPLTFFTLFQIYFETVASLANRIVVPKLIREVLVRILVIITCALYFFNWIDFHTVVLLNIAIYLIAMIANYFYAKGIIEISFKPDFNILTKSFKKEIVTYTSYTIVSSMSGIIVASLVTLILGAQEGLASTGIWRISLFVALFIDMPHRAIISITTPILSEALTHEQYDKVKDIATRTSSVQFLISSLIYLLVVSNIDNLFSVMPNGDEFRAGSSVILFVGASKLVEMISGLNSPIIGFKYFRFGLVFNVIVAVVSITANFYFIPLYSIKGAALATLTTAVVVHGIMHIFLAWRFQFTPLNKGILYTLLLLLFMLGINWFIPSMGHPILDGFLRCLILGTVYVLLAYRLKISPEINEIVEKFLKLNQRFNKK